MARGPTGSEWTWRRTSRRRLGLQPFKEGIGRLGDLGRGRARARHALAFRSRRELRRARTRRIASAPRRRCSTLPQRSILRNTGPNRVSDAPSQSRSACTGQALGWAPQATATWHTGSPTRVSSTAAPGRSAAARRRGRPARHARARRPSAAAGRDRAARRDPRGKRSPCAPAGRAAAAGRDGRLGRCGGSPGERLSPADRRPAKRDRAGGAGRRWRRHGGPARRRSAVPRRRRERTPRSPGRRAARPRPPRRTRPRRRSSRLCRAAPSRVRAEVRRTEASRPTILARAMKGPAIGCVPTCRPLPCSRARRHRPTRLRGRLRKAQRFLSVSLIDETAKRPTSEAYKFQVHETASRIVRLVLLDHANLLLGSRDIRRRPSFRRWFEGRALASPGS